LTDPVGNTTTWTYYALNRVVAETDPLGESLTYAYDAAGRLVSATDRLDRRRDFGYDLAGLLMSEVWFTSGSPVQTQTFDYDAAGNLVVAADPDGTYTLAYDALNWVEHVDEPFGVSLTFGYDAAGNRTRVEDSLGGVTTVVFDARNLQVAEEVGGSAMPIREERSYDAAGRLASTTRLAWASSAWEAIGTSTYDYDAASRVTGIVHVDASSNPLASYAYGYDAAGRLEWKDEDGNVTSYGYDATHQLTDDGGTTFTYDAGGNRTMDGYAVGAGNRLTTDGVWTYTHDVEGNVVKKSRGEFDETWVYEYDHRNQMVGARLSATEGGSVTQRVT
jgi:YD repeat-containing protein